MSAIGVGDWVECVRETPHTTTGSIYRVRGFHEFHLPCWSCGGPPPGVFLEGVRSGSWSFCPSCEVRPIYRPRADFIESLLVPSPEREVVRATVRRMSESSVASLGREGFKDEEEK